MQQTPNGGRILFIPVLLIRKNAVYLLFKEWPFIFPQRINKVKKMFFYIIFIIYYTKFILTKCFLCKQQKTKNFYVCGKILNRETFCTCSIFSCAIFNSHCLLHVLGFVPVLLCLQQNSTTFLLFNGNVLWKPICACFFFSGFCLVISRAFI